MLINCRKYKTTRKLIGEVEPSFLRSFFDKLIPGAKFRFITFEGDDYRKLKLTFLFFDIIPQKVIVCVQHVFDIKYALREIIRINPHVLWPVVKFHYHVPTEKGQSEVLIELWLNTRTMQINNSGRLIVE